MDQISRGNKEESVEVSSISVNFEEFMQTGCKDQGALL